MYPGNSTALSQQTTGDCKQNVCDGAGNSTTIADPNDLPTPTSACQINPACAGSTPQFDPAPTGTTCTSSSDPNASVCGDISKAALAGTCVECNSDNDCGGAAFSDAGTSRCDTTTGTCVSCVAAGHTVGSTSECATECCSNACSSGVTCQ